METAKNNIKIVLLEDNVDDVELIKHELKKAAYNFDIRHVDTEKSFKDLLSSFEADIILSDYSLPTFNGLKALALAQQLRPGIPYIFVSGHIGEDRAIDAMRRGATDYVVKDRLKKLVPTIERALKDASERKLRIQAEEARRESEEKYRVLFDKSYDAIFLIQNDLILDCNSSAEKVFGYTKESLIGKTLFDLSPLYQSTGKLTRVLAEEKLLHAYDSEPQNFEWIFKRKDDSEFEAETSLTRLDFNEKIYLQLIVRDISAEKLAIKQLSVSQQRYKSLFVNNPDGVFSLDLKGTLTSVNRSLVNLSGYEEDEVIDKYFGYFIHPDDLAKATNFFNNAIKGEAAKFELRIITKAGKIRCLKIVITPIIVEEKIFGVFGITRDITNEKAAQELNERLMSIIEASPDFIGYANPAAEVLYVNRSFMNNINLKPKNENERLKITDLHPEWAGNLVMNEGVPTAGKEGLWWGETALLTKDGDEIPTSQVILAHKNKSGEIQYYSTIARDISESKELQMNLLEAKDKAEEMNRLKTNFLENMSHEIRTPLIGILGYSELLIEELHSEEYSDMINAIHKSGLRLLETMNLILDLSRIEAERLDLDYQEINLVETVKESINTFYAMAKNKNLELKLISPNEEIMGVTDERILIEILNNLINNAIKYTNTGGVYVSISKVNNGNSFRTIVEDTGIGIDNSKFDIIFDEFRQVSEGYSRKFEGTGLGLALTKKFVQKLKGSIDVESVVDKGSKFIVEIPIDNKIKQSKSDFELVRNETSAKQGINKKLFSILLVEDDEINQSIIAEFLKNKVQLHVVSNTEAAREKLQQKSDYDLILMDINLGKGENGLELALHIKRNENLNKIPIVALSAYAMVNDRATFLNSGCDDYLSKPFSRDDLITIIEKWVNSKLT